MRECSSLGCQTSLEFFVVRALQLPTTTSTTIEAGFVKMMAMITRALYHADR